MDGVKATYTHICHHIGVHHSHCGVATTQCCSNSNSQSRRAGSRVIAYADALSFFETQIRYDLLVRDIGILGGQNPLERTRLLGPNSAQLVPY